MNQIDIDDKYISSTAYHESGHTVIAAVQQMPMRNFGVRMDSLGCGKAFYWRRVADGSRNNVGSDVERDRTIISTSTGYIAQKRFYGDALTDDIDRYMQFSANADTSLVIELLQEMSIREKPSADSTNSRLLSGAHVEFRPARKVQLCRRG